MTEATTQTVAAWQKAGILLVEDGNHGEYRPLPTEFVSDGVAFIRAADMDTGTVQFDQASKIGPKAVARITKGIGKPGDILFSHKGTVGKLAIVATDAPPFVCSPQTTFWRVLNREILNPRYLYYYMQSWEFRQQWESCKGETDMADYVSLTAQRRLEVTIPNINTQDRVVEILGAIDDKIIANLRLNETLHAMGSALFKSWFIDFDPVVARRDGRKPLVTSVETTELFPNSFQDSVLGPIPEGWRIGQISDLCEFVETGGTPSRQQASFWTGGNVPWFKTGELQDRPLLRSEEFITTQAIERTNCKIWQPGTILFAIYASPTLGRMGILEVPGTCNQASAALRAKDSVGQCYLFEALKDARDQLQAIASGAAQQNINLRILREHRIVIPWGACCMAFSRVAGPWYRLLALNAKTNASLIATRNLLLPRLLAGEVRVKAAERVFSEVT